MDGSKADICAKIHHTQLTPNCYRDICFMLCWVLPNLCTVLWMVVASGQPPQDYNLTLSGKHLVYNWPLQRSMLSKVHAHAELVELVELSVFGLWVWCQAPLPVFCISFCKLNPLSTLWRLDHLYTSWERHEDLNTHYNIMMWDFRSAISYPETYAKQH